MILVSDSPAAVSEAFALAADAVLDIGPTLPRHVLARTELCLNLGSLPIRRNSPRPFRCQLSRPPSAVAGPVARAIKLMRRAVAPKLSDISGSTPDDLQRSGRGRRLLAGVGHRPRRLERREDRLGRRGSGHPVQWAAGTGKTTFAGALVRTCDVHLVLGSSGRWQSKSYFGDMLKVMRAASMKRRRDAPLIIFLDEIDAAIVRSSLTKTPSAAPRRSPRCAGT